MRGARSREAATLRGIAAIACDCFAYPNGKAGNDYAAARRADTRHRFRRCRLYHPGVATAGSDPMELPRFTPWDRGRMAFGVRLGMNARHPVIQADARPAAA